MQKGYTYLIAAAVVAWFFSSCEKTDFGDCFKSTGKTVLEFREAGSFEHIFLYDNVNLILTQDNKCRIIVEAGENLIGSVLTEVKDNQLIIRNNNQCNWIRNYKNEIDVYVSVDHLVSITYNSSGNIIGTNSIISDSLSIQVWDGSGNINLDVNLDKALFALHYGAVDFVLTGRAGLCFIFAASYGPFYCEELYTDLLFMDNRGSNDCYVNCQYHLEVEIENIGNIYYRGDPEEVIANITGTGKLIKLD